jgi:hypothetical protein
VFHDDEHVIRTLTKILDAASTSHRKLDPTEGLQDAQLDSGARLHIVHSDLARGGHVMVNVRKFTGLRFHSLAELVALDMLTAQAADFLKACVKARLSIVFAGPPGSGKTTMLSCCAADLDPTLRVVIAEEVFEADVPVPNLASMQTRPTRSDRSAVDLRRLVSGFMRMAPDVAIVGEVRDREGLPEIRGAPRSAMQPGGVEGPTCGLSQQATEAGGSLTREAPGRVGAASTTPGRAGTARRPGSGKRDGEVYECRNQWWNPLKSGTGSNLVDVGR